MVPPKLSRWVLVEYLSSTPGDRRIVEGIGVLDMSSEEASEMNKRLVWTPCRVHPAKWFVDFREEE
jgi:trehalose utilization protein